MANDLMVIPDFKVGEVKFIDKVNVYFDGIPRVTQNKPFYHFGNSSHWIKLQRDVYRFYSTYIYRSRFYNPIQALLNINRYLNQKEYLETRDIKYWGCGEYEGVLFENSKFILQKMESCYPEILPYKMDTYKIVIDYFLIREEIISYLSQKYSDDKYVQEQLEKFKEVFKNDGNIESYEKANYEKMKYLKNIDYDFYGEYLQMSKEDLQKQRDERKKNGDTQ
jgi:hypothetical protein